MKYELSKKLIDDIGDFVDILLDYDDRRYIIFSGSSMEDLAAVYEKYDSPKLKNYKDLQNSLKKVGSDRVRVATISTRYKSLQNALVLEFYGNFTDFFSTSYSSGDPSGYLNKNDLRSQLNQFLTIVLHTTTHAAHVVGSKMSIMTFKLVMKEFVLVYESMFGELANTIIKTGKL